MEYRFVRTANEIIELDILNCHFRYVVSNDSGELSPKLQQALGIVLFGKPAIAAFMGVSEKTLKRWFAEYPDMPIKRGGRICSAFSDNLLRWMQKKKLDSARNSRKQSADMEHNKLIALDLLINNYALKLSLAKNSKTL